MGCTTSAISTKSINPMVEKKPPIYKIALKLPKHCDKNGKGKIYKYYNNGKFIIDDDINIWIKNLFLNKNWNNWIVYNDQIEKLGLSHTSNGHTKGILVWNDSKIGYLIHSTPNFPKSFNGSTISEIDDNELIFGQNYIFIEIEYTIDMLNLLFLQILNLSPNIYMFNSNISLPQTLNKKEYEPIILYLNEDITHISKSPLCNSDIYEHLSEKYDITLKVQSWLRGGEDGNMKDTNTVTNINTFKGEKDDSTYKSTQNHSKFAVSNKSSTIIGDLNRMISQKKRGGGCLYIKDHMLTSALNNEILS